MAEVTHGPVVSVTLEETECWQPGSRPILVSEKKEGSLSIY